MKDALDIPWFLRQDPVKAGQEIMDAKDSRVKELESRCEFMSGIIEAESGYAERINKLESALRRMADEFGVPLTQEEEALLKDKG